MTLCFAILGALLGFGLGRQGQRATAALAVAVEDAKARGSVAAAGYQRCFCASQHHTLSSPESIIFLDCVLEYLQRFKAG